MGNAAAPAAARCGALRPSQQPVRGARQPAMRGRRARRVAARAQRSEVEQIAIGQLRGHDIAQRAEDRLQTPGVLAFPGVHHLPHLLALQVLLRTAQAARDDRERAQRGVLGDLGLGDVGQRPDHDVLAVVRAQLGRHGLEAALEKQVQEKRGDDVVAVVPQRDLVETRRAGVLVNRAAAQARAQAAQRPAFRHHAPDHAVSVLLQHGERHAARGQVIGQHVRGKAGLLLVQVHRDQLERDRRARLQRQQDIQQRV